MGKKLREFTSGEVSVDFSTLSGEILSLEKSSETRTSVSGGHVFQTSAGVSSTPIRVSSTTDKFQEIWIRKDDGVESSVKLINVDFPLRAGQKVTFLYAKWPGSKVHEMVSVVNHNARANYIFSDPCVRFSTYRFSRLIVSVIFGVLISYVLFNINLNVNGFRGLLNPEEMLKYYPASILVAVAMVFCAIILGWVGPGMRRNIALKRQYTDHIRGLTKDLCGE